MQFCSTPTQRADRYQHNFSQANEEERGCHDQQSGALQASHVLRLVCRCGRVCRDLRGFRERVYVQRLCRILTEGFRSFARFRFVFSLAGFLYFGLGIVSGPLADRWGSRRLAVAGMILVGLGLAAASMARSLVEIYWAYGVGVGLGVGASYVPVVGAVQRWFLRRRGFASGLAVSGIGVGTLAMPPLASFLIEAQGWRKAYLIL